MMSYFFEWVLEAMNSNNLDATGPKFIKEQEDWHQNHQGQQGDCEHINYNCCITQIPVFRPQAIDGLFSDPSQASGDRHEESDESKCGVYRNQGSPQSGGPRLAA